MSVTAANRSGPRILLSKEERRTRGVVYTPAALADFVVDYAVRAGAQLSAPVLDPCCGEGIFLTSWIGRLVTNAEESGRDLQGSDRTKFLEEIRERIHGIDIDPGSVVAARKSVVSLLESAVGGTLPGAFMDDNIVQADFLGKFYSPSRRFQSIIGNPPYVSAQSISANKSNEYRENFVGAQGRLELYTLFMEKATTLLEDKGIWAFITPDKYLTSKSAGALRSHLSAEGQVLALARFSSHKVFPDAAVVPCITVWGANGELKTPVRLTSLMPSVDGTYRPRIVHDAFQEPISSQNHVDWRFIRPKVNTLLSKMQASGNPLESYVSRISAGVTTGYNPAFILNDNEAHHVEKELLHATVRGRDIRAFKIATNAQQMLVPYEWDAHGVGSLISLADYAGAYAWLDRYRERLAARHCVRVWGRKWWDLHDSLPRNITRATKILVPDLAKSNRFALDLGKHLPQHSAYYMEGGHLDPVVLTKVLNSSPLQLFIRATAPRAKDGFLRYRAQYLRNLPVPHLSPQQMQALALSDELSQHDEDTISTSFGLNFDEVTRALTSLDE